MRVARDEFIFHVTPLRQEPVEISTAASEQRRSPCACRRNCVYANNRCVKVRACDASFRWFRTMRCLHISVCVCAIFIIVFWLIYYARSRPTTLSLARSFNLDVCVNSLLIAFTNSTLDIRNNTRHCNCVCTSVFNEKTWIYLCETHLYGQLKFSNSHFLQIISLISAICAATYSLRTSRFWEWQCVISHSPDGRWSRTRWLERTVGRIAVSNLHRVGIIMPRWLQFTRRCKEFAGVSQLLSPIIAAGEKIARALS